MKKIIVFLTLLVSVTVLAQGEASNWYFGNGAGLNFDINNGLVTANALAVNTISTNEGCSSISDPDGNLLFYTDGRTVWNTNHQIMPNADYNAGSGLLGDPSSTSSAVIVPKPGNPNQYYIFTVDEPHHNNSWAYPNQGPADINGNSITQYDDNNGNGGLVPFADDGYNNGFNYSLVDLTLNGGTGDIVTAEKNIHLVTYNPNDVQQASYKCAEKITAVEHNDEQSYWVITHFINTFYAFRVDNNGVNPTPVTSQELPFIGTNGYRRNSIGYIKSSPDGSKIAVCHIQNSTAAGTNQPSSGSFWLYDFDSTTGIVSNGLNLISNSTYGADFSADSNKLYVSNLNRVIQFDLDASNISASGQTVHQGSSFVAAIQLGPDGKIYICNTVSSTALDVINTPEELGSACNYQVNGISLSNGTFASLGLPPFIQSFLTAKIEAEFLCEGDTTQFTIDSSETYVSILWDFGDNNTSIDDSPTHIYSNPGTYLVTATLTTTNETKIFTKTITISKVPVANAPSHINICDDNNDDIWTFDLTLQNPSVLGTQDDTIYSVSYFASQADADNNENEIIGLYNNVINPQEIFVRIDNNGNSNCYDTTSFFIEIFDTPSANVIGDWEICDDDIDGNDMNGQREFDLSTLNLVVLGTQNVLQYDITYHGSQTDADSRNNPLPTTYYNTTPITEEIFVRIENIDNTDCYDTISFNLIVNLVPEAFDSSLFQCDEDGNPDGFTLFNLTEANDDLTGAIADRSTKFFLSLADAQNSTNQIDGNSFSNTLNPQTIFVQVINDVTGCYSISELFLDVTATDANDAYLSHCDDDGTEDGFYNFDLSQADSMILNGLPATVTISYYETYEDSLLERNEISAPFTNTIAYSQTIFARVENDNACYGITQVELTVYELPNIETEFETLYCLNFFPQTISLDSGLISNAPSDFTYLWSTGETTQDIQINAPGTYTVTVTNNNGCNKQRIITVLPSNIATFENIDVVDATSNNTITVLVSGEGDYEYSLNEINGPYQDSNYFDDVPPGLHTIYVKDKNNCGVVSDIISVIGFPKFFTPNGDSYNDTWHVYGINDPSQFSSDIYIFDRYGKLLKQLSPQGQGWDGTFNGEDMQTNDYWFHVKLQDGRVFKSHFTLKR